MIDCDDHDSASNAAPNFRHHLKRHSNLIYKYQIDRYVPRMMHNHPSGDPTPSSADIAMTKQIVDVAKPLGVTVHDHIIVGKDGHASFRGLRLI